jgi:hypothetical protein
MPVNIPFYVHIMYHIRYKVAKPIDQSEYGVDLAMIETFFNTLALTIIHKSYKQVL